MSETPQKPLVPDQPTVSRKFWIALSVTCAVSILLELIVVLAPDLHRHEHFESSDSAFASATNGFGFYVVLGFLACSSAILLAKGLGLLLKKKENYYDDTP
jgi:hypothetical protein